MASKIALSDLNAMSAADLVVTLANVFEYSPWIAEAAAARRPFASVTALFAAMNEAVMGASAAQKMALIKAHPDLADKTRRAAGLTAESHAEQSGAGLDQLSDAEYEAFAKFNARYRDKFGFPYIVCVRRHSKDSILRDFAGRLPNEPAQEIDAALGEIVRIAALRLAEKVEGEGPLAVHGRLSTHVLDNHAGRPAEGMALELVEMCELGAPRPIFKGRTNADGRTDVPLIAGRPLPIGRYELRFAVGDYFARREVAVSDPPFLDEVPLRFSIAEPEGHYHVPLLITPWSYSTYRGS